MPRIKLTDDRVAKLPHPKSGIVWYSDSSFPAFQLAVGQSTKTFYALGWVKGRNKAVRMKLGRASMMTATAARRAAGDALDLMSKGIDPRKQEPEPAPVEHTLQSVLDHYVAHRQSRGRLSEKVAGHYRAAVVKHCPDWLPRPIGEITKAEVRALHDGLEHKPFAANNLLRVLGALFSHAIDRMDIELPRNPAKGIDLYPERVREGIHDWQAWHREVQAIENSVRRSFHLLAALTGIRRSNLAELRWQQVDFRKRTVQLGKTKNGSTPLLPLSRAAVRELIALRRLGYAEAEKLERPISQWVFPSLTSASGHIEEPREEKVRGCTHSMRHMFSTAGAECGIPKYVLKRLRGDITKEDALDGYIHNITTHTAVNRIADELHRRWGVKRAAAEPRTAAERRLAA